MRFLSSCQYTHGCCTPASWAARHTTVCLDTTNVGSDDPEEVYACLFKQNLMQSYLIRCLKSQKLLLEDKEVDDIMS